MSKAVVTPIGTCRIHTPLRRAASRGTIELDKRRNYGFTHTSSEALQQLRYMLGEKQFAPEAVPYVMLDRELGSFEQERWQVADFHFVEVSSLKQIMLGDDIIQINYLYRQLGDFFADPKRTSAYWATVKTGDRPLLREWLRREPAYAKLPLEQRRLLNHLKFVRQNFAAIKADMNEIAERVGRDRIAFVTHVNARLPDGSEIETRDRLMRWVKTAANQLELPVYDPTPPMLAYGQERAMEEGGADLTHFTGPFSDRVFSDFYGKFLAPMMARHGDRFDDEGDPFAIQMAAEGLSEELASGDYFEASQKVFEALRERPQEPAFRELAGMVRYRLGDLEGFAALCGELAGREQLTDEARVALLDSYVRLGRGPEAVTVSRALLSDEVESEQILRLSAEAHALVGRDDRALNFHQQLFRADPDKLGEGLAALQILCAGGDEAELEAWRGEFLSHIRDESADTAEVARWALANRDRDLLLAIFQPLLSQDYGRAEDLFQTLLESDLDDVIASAWRKLWAATPPDERASARRDALLKKLVTLGVDRLDNGQMAQAFVLATTALVSGPNRVAERVRFKTVRHFRVAVRQAYSAKDYGAAVEAARAAGDALYEAPDALVPAILSLQQEGHDAEAMALADRARALYPDDVMLTRWAARIAAKLGELEVAYRAYRDLRAAGGEEAARFHDEADRFLDSWERRNFAAMREQSEAGDFAAAIDMLDMAEKRGEDLDRLERERRKVAQLLRKRLGEVRGSDEAAEQERADVLEQLLRVEPNHPTYLRQAAILAMRQMRFAEAAELWRALGQVGPVTETVERNLDKCLKLAEKQDRAADIRGAEAA